MKRFVVAAALAVALGLGSAGTADAQIVYGYTVPAPGGIVRGGTVIGPGAAKNFQSYYSPFTGTVQRQVQYADVFGRSYGSSYGYNPWTGGAYNTGYFNPGFNPGLNPGFYPGFYPTRFPQTEYQGYLRYKYGWR